MNRNRNYFINIFYHTFKHSVRADSNISKHLSCVWKNLKLFFLSPWQFLVCDVIQIIVHHRHWELWCWVWISILLAGYNFSHPKSCLLQDSWHIINFCYSSSFVVKIAEMILGVLIIQSFKNLPTKNGFPQFTIYLVVTKLAMVVSA